ncbi:MAG: tetratricopeptide repeat protein [Ktedonobacteraceae bacterium]|nr:tetratricopeptide repeat protein [Ktedonobacteraceae bacterium]
MQEGHYDAARQAASEELLLLEQQQSMPVEQETSTLLTTFDNRSTTRIQRILTGDPVDLGRAYRRLGDIACTVGLRSEGLAHLHTALSIYERYNYKREIAHVSCNLSYNYFKKGEHRLAREILQRAFNLAESMHDDPLLSVVYSDLAAFAAAAGAHEEAERWYKRALELAEHTNDREYLSRWNAALALSLEQQDKLKEASDCAVYALKIGRATHKNPCIGEALVALGNLRLLQANEVVPLPTKRPRMRSHLLKQARKLLTCAIALNGVEAETKTRAQILLSRVSLASTELQQARTEAAQALAMARDYELAQEEALALELQQQLAIQ